MSMISGLQLPQAVKPKEEIVSNESPSQTNHLRFMLITSLFFCAFLLLF